jgi:hypothetical protein
MINTILSFVFISRDKWGFKDKISGYYINKNSKIVDTVFSQRSEKHGNIFHTESQAKGMISMAKLSQQLADFNGDWKPDWGNKNETKYCISLLTPAIFFSFLLLNKVFC